jgi:hypothetical protein
MVVHTDSFVLLGSCPPMHALRLLAHACWQARTPYLLAYLRRKDPDMLPSYCS